MTLSTWIPSYMGKLNDYLAWDDGSQVDFIISEVLEELNINSEDEVDEKTLHAVAKVKALEFALRDLSIGFKFSGDGVSIDPTSVFEQVQNMLSLAYSEYQPAIVAGKINYTNDPYNPATYEDFWG